MANHIVKYWVDRLYQPIVKKYLSRTRKYRYKGVRLLIHPQVFHPGFFFSTKLLIKFLETKNLQQKTLIELGAGSGLISMIVAQKGAIVTASDINETAISFLHTNSRNNGINLKIIHSNLFDKIAVQFFDYIIINPPFYRKNPTNNAEYAWYCGEDGAYFKQLFSQLANYVHSQTQVIMILSSGCDIDFIAVLALENSFELLEIQRYTNWLETNFIYNVSKISKAD